MQENKLAIEEDVMKKLIFISAVSGVGKSTACEYIRNEKKIKSKG